MGPTGISGISGTNVIDLNHGSVAPPSNTNEGISQSFINEATRVGQEEIDAGNAPLDADPYQVVLNLIAQNIPLIMNVTNFEFDSAPD